MTRLLVYGIFKVDCFMLWLGKKTNWKKQDKVIEEKLSEKVEDVESSEENETGEKGEKDDVRKRRMMK